MSAEAIIISIRNSEGEAVTSTVVGIDRTDARQVHIMHTDDGSTALLLAECTWGDNGLRVWANPTLTTKG